MVLLKLSLVLALLSVGDSRLKKVYELYPKNQFNDPVEVSSKCNMSRGHEPLNVAGSQRVDNRFQKRDVEEQTKDQIVLDHLDKLVFRQKLSRILAPGAMEWNYFHTLEEIQNWMRNLTKLHSRVSRLLNAGKSFEGRDLLGIHISYNRQNSNKSIFLEGTMHAREWLSASTVTFILHQLLHSSDPKVRKLAENHDWYIFPIVNPDGYVYTFTSDRFWRKTRVPYGECFGADPNRNFDIHWNDTISTKNPCSQYYRGPKPFSEPSVKALSSFIESISSKLFGYISFHAYGQQIWLPFGFSPNPAGNLDEMMVVANHAIEGLSRRYGTKYVIGNNLRLTYRVTGSSVDWVKGKFKVPVVVTYHLRDSGEKGLLISPDQIIPTGLETLDSLVALFDSYEERYTH